MQGTSRYVEFEQPTQHAHTLAVSPRTIRVLFKHYRHLVPEFDPSDQDIEAFREFSGVQLSQNSKEAAETLFEESRTTAKGQKSESGKGRVRVSFENYVRGIHVAAKMGTFEDKVRFLFQAYDL